MSFDLQDQLARPGRHCGAPGLRSARGRGSGRTVIRRRNRIMAAGAALALAVSMGVTALVLDRGHDQTGPVDRPDGDELTWTPGTRPLTYGQEQTLHLGTRVIDTGIDFLSVALTDDGAALTTIDGGIWFTDGETVERIGATLAGRVRSDGVGWLGGRPRDWVVTDTTGSLMAWLEYPDPAPGPSGAGGLRLGQPGRAGPAHRSRCPAVARRAWSPWPVEGSSWPTSRMASPSPTPSAGTTWTPARSSPSTPPTCRRLAARSAPPWSSVPRHRTAGCSTGKATSAAPTRSTRSRSTTTPSSTGRRPAHRRGRRDPRPRGRPIQHAAVRPVARRRPVHAHRRQPGASRGPARLSDRRRPVRRRSRQVDLDHRVSPARSRRSRRRTALVRAMLSVLDTRNGG